MHLKNLFVLNKRVLVFIIIGLLVLEWAVVISISQKFAHPERQRLPAYDLATVGLWIDQVKRYNGFKVVVLGDSVVHGDAVESSYDTLPACIFAELQELLPEKNIKVFNMGLAGASPAEVFFILDALEGSGVDLFIYDINIGWFSRKKVLEHQSLTELKGSLSSRDLKDLGIEPIEVTDTPAEKWLSNSIFSHWRLYQYRVLLNYWLFGKPLREKLEEAKKDPHMLVPFAENNSPETLAMRAAWKEKNWDGKLDPAKGRVGSVCLGDNNKQWLFYRMLTGEIRKKELTAVFFTTPRNYRLLDLYGMIDRPAYSRNLAIIVNEATDNGIKVLYYDHAIPYDLFSDTVHPLPEGNKILASRISRELIEKGYIKR
jgi:hypothetical protein